MSAAVATKPTNRSPSAGKTKLPLLDVNFRDPAVAQNLIRQMSSEGFSVSDDSKGKYSIVAGDAKIQISVSGKEKVLLTRLMSEVEQNLGSYNQKYYANRLINELAKIDSVVLKSKVSYAASADRSLNFTEVDKLATALCGEKVDFNYAKLLKGKMILVVDRKYLELVNAGKAEDPEAVKALQIALISCLEANQDATPVARATALTRLICNFKYKGQELNIQAKVSNLEELENKSKLKVDKPKSLSEALEISAQHILSSEAGQINSTVSLNQDNGLFSLTLENSRSKLVFDIDGKLLSRIKEPLKFLESLAQDVKAKAATLLNTEAGVTGLSDFIQAKIAEIPVNKLSSNPIAEFAHAGESSYFDLSTGAAVKKPNQQAARGTFAKQFYSGEQAIESAAVAATESTPVQPVTSPFRIAEPEDSAAAGVAGTTSLSGLPPFPVIDADEVAATPVPPSPVVPIVSTAMPIAEATEPGVVRPPPLPAAASSSLNKGEFYRRRNAAIQDQAPKGSIFGRGLGKLLRGLSDVVLSVRKSFKGAE